MDLVKILRTWVSNGKPKPVEEPEPEETVDEETIEPEQPIKSFWLRWRMGEVDIHRGLGR